MRHVTFACLLVCHALACSGPKPAPRAAESRPCDLPATSANAPTPDAFVLAGSDFVQKARAKSEPDLYRNAETCAAKALELDPDHLGALRLQGLVMLNDHQFERARDLALKMLARKSEDALTWGTLSDAYLELGDMPAAIDAAQRMLDIKPNLPSYGRAAHLRWLQGDAVSAKRLYQLAIGSGTGQKDPEPRAWMIVQAAWLFWHEGDYRGADFGFDAALRRLPEYAPALEGKGRVALSERDYPAAIDWLTRAERAKPTAPVSALLGDAYALAGATDKAAQVYARVEREGRHDPRSVASFLATHDRKASEALELARTEWKQRKDVYTKDVLALALYRNGQVTEADKLAREVVASGIQDAGLLYHAGLIRRAAARDQAGKAEGQALMADALRKNPRLDPILTGERNATELAQNR
ncbi:MAG TPA: tetratricopeptide repeat protein [Polyangiales bacterium]|nr:tetratricopeptide repeat protein [Polyangiales bacterium]